MKVYLLLTLLVIDICFNAAGLSRFMLTGIGSSTAYMIRSNWQATAEQREAMVTFVSNVFLILCFAVVVFLLGWLVAISSEATLYLVPRLRRIRSRALDTEPTQTRPDQHGFGQDNTNQATPDHTTFGAVNSGQIESRNADSDQTGFDQSNQETSDHGSSERSATDVTVKVEQPAHDEVTGEQQLGEQAGARATIMGPGVIPSADPRTSTKCMGMVKNGSHCKRMTLNPPFCHFHRQQLH